MEKAGQVIEARSYDTKCGVWTYFTADDGQINLGTNEECIKACQDALNGWDPTYGCIYYYNPKTATNAWIWSRPVVVTIGNHVFCK